MVETVSFDAVKKNVDIILKLLLVHKKIAVVKNNGTRFIVSNPNREAIAKELGYLNFQKGNIHQ